MWRTSITKNISIERHLCKIQSFLLTLCFKNLQTMLSLCTSRNFNPFIHKVKRLCHTLVFLWAHMTKRPFYHMRPEKDKRVTKSFDLVYKGVEIATGAQREHRLEILEAQCKEKGLDLTKMPFYRDIFRYGCPPHGGVGLGLDRITERLLDLGNIREAILLPRDPERLTP